jgi:hypothetical protein
MVPTCRRTASRTLLLFAPAFLSVVAVTSPAFSISAYLATSDAQVVDAMKRIGAGLAFAQSGDYGTEGGGGGCALWYETVSPSGDGKILYKELERFEFRGTNADRTFGPYTMPKGPGKFSLCPGWGGIVANIRVEVADPDRGDEHREYEKRVDGKVRFTSKGG